MPRNSPLVALCLLTVCASPGSASILSMLTPAIERAASYGYYILGYDQPAYQYGSGEIDIPHVKEPIWNGHIPVGDFLSPLLSALGGGKGSHGYGYDDRIVRGYENRLGLRVAVPYLGDFQVTREIGPGRFLDKLGPGEYPYPGLKSAVSHSTSYGGGYGGGGYEDSKPPESGSYIPDNTAVYQGMKNYPWYRR
nr:uncharacterized protein LOC123766397 [Procambarus clarkii]